MATASARSLPALMYSIEGGTPTEIIEKLNREINTALSDSKMKARLADLGQTMRRARGRSRPRSVRSSVFERVIRVGPGQ